MKEPCPICGWIMLAVYHKDNKFDKGNEMKTQKTHRTCGECRNSKEYKAGEFSLLCKKLGIEVISEDCCEDFVPKKQKIKSHKNLNDEFIQSSVDENLAKLQAETLFELSNKTCLDCKLYVPIDERHLDPYNSVRKVAACLKIRNACKEFKPKIRTLVDRLGSAAQRYIATGDRRDLQNYSRLRREML